MCGVFGEERKVRKKIDIKAFLQSLSKKKKKRRGGGGVEGIPPETNWQVFETKSAGDLQKPNEEGPLGGRGKNSKRIVVLSNVCSFSQRMVGERETVLVWTEDIRKRTWGILAGGALEVDFKRFLNWVPGSWHRRQKKRAPARNA